MNEPWQQYNSYDREFLRPKDAVTLEDTHSFLVNKRGELIAQNKKPLAFGFKPNKLKPVSRETGKGGAK